MKKNIYFVLYIFMIGFIFQSCTDRRYGHLTTWRSAPKVAKQEIKPKKQKEQVLIVQSKENPSIGITREKQPPVLVFAEQIERKQQTVVSSNEVAKAADQNISRYSLQETDRKKFIEAPVKKAERRIIQKLKKSPLQDMDDLTQIILIVLLVILVLAILALLPGIIKWLLSVLLLVLLIILILRLLE